MNRAEVVVYTHAYGDRPLTRIPLKYRVPASPKEAAIAIAITTYRVREGMDIPPFMHQAMLNAYGHVNASMALDDSKTVSGVSGLLSPASYSGANMN